MDALPTPSPDDDLLSADVVTEALPTHGTIDFATIELMFFAYREFTADADSLLAPLNFGRAHHRILHFVNRDPGMTIADLLELLQITKQSLSRVLRQLIDDGFVKQMQGCEDRRQRRLFPTQKGRQLTLELSHAQARRIEDALVGAETAELTAISNFLSRMGSDNEATRNWFARKGINSDKP